MKQKLVIIGNGMAPGRMLEDLFERAPDAYDVTIFNAEPRVNYNRLVLSPVLSGEKTYEDIITHDDGWYAANGVTLLKGEPVETVDRSAKAAGSAHVCIDGIENEALLYLLDEADVCASAASACASGAMEPSHVLAAMGVDRELALGALRLSLGHTTTDADVDRALEVIVAAVGRLRRKAAS